MAHHVLKFTLKMRFNIKLCGIYYIKNTRTKKYYIGCSVDIYRRWRGHLCELRNNRHHNNYLQNSWRKYGENFFEFKIVEECAIEDRLGKEKYFIKKFNSKRPFGYNLNNGGVGNVGFKFSKEVSLKRSKEAMGNRNPMYGRKHSEETKKIFSKQRIGNKNGLYNKNNFEKIKRYKNSSSKYFGVSRRVYRGKEKESICWRARFSNNGRNVHLGTFATEAEAAKVFDMASWEKYKNLDKLNFPSNYKLLDI